MLWMGILKDIRCKDLSRGYEMCWVVLCSFNFKMSCPNQSNTFLTKISVAKITPVLVLRIGRTYNGFPKETGK